MNSLYNLALRQSSSIHSEMTQLEAIPSSEGQFFISKAGQLSASLAAMGRTVDDYESMAKREFNVQKREKALERVKKFREEEKDLRCSFTKIKSGNTNAGQSSTVFTSAPTNGRINANYYHNDSISSSTMAVIPTSPYDSFHARSAISTRQQHSNTNNVAGALPPQDRPDPLSSYRMNASAAAMFGGGTDEGMSAREGYALREHSFIQQTESQLDNFINQGKEIWNNITEQRDILKGTQRRLRDVGVTLGLSRDVIGFIERRSTQDNMIFVIGAIFTLICFFYIYKWFG